VLEGPLGLADREAHEVLVASEEAGRSQTWHFLILSRNYRRPTML
jgi:hypothetical protein